MVGKPDRRCSMKMPDCETNEAGPVTAESGFESATRYGIIATAMGYSQNGCMGKQNALTVVTPAGPIAIRARQPQRALSALINAGSQGVTALNYPAGLTGWALMCIPCAMTMGWQSRHCANPMMAAGTVAMCCTHPARLSAVQHEGPRNVAKASDSQQMQRLHI